MSLNDLLKVLLLVDIMHFLCIAHTTPVTTFVMSTLCIGLRLGAKTPQLGFHCIPEPEEEHDLSLYTGRPDSEHTTISTTVL